MTINESETSEVVTIDIEGAGRVSLQRGSTIRELLEDAASGLAQLDNGESGTPVAASVSGRLCDLSASLESDATVRIVISASEDGRAILCHSTAHVMAQAVRDLWPGARYAIGPSTIDGFYYDFDLPGGVHFTDTDLDRIEGRMREIVAEDQPFSREEHDIAEGLSIFDDQPYKVEIIETIASEAGSRADSRQRAKDGHDGEVGNGASSQSGSEATEGPLVSVYRNTGSSTEFVDLCRGPHVPSTGYLDHFKLLKVAGSYWRGDEKRQQLQRIYGTAWESGEALAAYLKRLEEAEMRDHRRLGTELDLFHFPSEIGGGLPVFHPKGAMIRTVLEDFARKEHLGAGYLPVWTPHVARSTLYEKSGHLEWYADNMYPPMEMEGAEYRLKPMNCPMHILVYANKSRSYRELPMRLFELGTVYRFERSGVLHGLARVRGLTQDDAHIFCTPEQLHGELELLVAFVLKVLQAFGFDDFEAELSTRPGKFVGEVADWDLATDALAGALSAAGISYRVAEGEGAFYAPKIDIHLTDAIGRRWQVSTLQVDLQLPARFGLSYIGADNERHQPYMVHRALFGSVERFMALLIEHYAGALPAWLAPVQMLVVPVGTSHEEYGQELSGQLAAAGFRAEMRRADEPLGARIRKGKLEKVPYILVVGDEDVQARTAGVNKRGSAKPQRGVSIDDFVAEVTDQVASRSSEL
ncbi:MAG: threonine--tRNA ligase [Acidimicrobiales bacterium]